MKLWRPVVTPRSDGTCPRHGKPVSCCGCPTRGLPDHDYREFNGVLYASPRVVLRKAP